jgi:hypothetical protein
VTDAGDHPGGHPDEVGSAAEEAAKLFGAFSDWARDHGADLGVGLGGLAGQAAAAARDVSGHVATGAEECRWCPVCRAVHVLRSASPEAREHLAAAVTSLAEAATAMLATSVPGDRARSRDVEHIDLDGDGDGDETEADPT